MHMLIAMGLAAALCVGIGVFPGALYAILPYSVEYAPYTASHVISQLQLLVFSALAFAVLMRTGIYPPELKAINLDFDWIYRRAGPQIARVFLAAHAAAVNRWGDTRDAAIAACRDRLSRWNLTGEALRRPYASDRMGLWVMLMLVAYLVLYHAP
jgi:multicomponent Na+:H+ antiporter subunit D